MKMAVVFKLFFGSFASIAFYANAYEVGTHSRLTESAYEKSVLAADALLERSLGVGTFIEKNAVNPFGDKYYDISGSQIRTRAASSYVTLENRMPSQSDAFRLKGWLMRGAIREDDIPDYPPFLGDNPQDDPNGKIARVLNHFYDPVNQSPLTVAGLPLGIDAPTWATGAEEAFGCPNCEDLNRRNHVTIRDARIAQWRALTGQDRFGNTAIAPNGQPSDDSVRKAYWATLFRSLGDVLHLIQDMGQPQHTRNEAHSPANGYSRTVFEAYTEARATGGQFKCAGGALAQAIPPLNFGAYPVPGFSRYSEYFSTVPTDMNGVIETARGMADYSNRGFFTAGSNINNTDYVLPDPNPSAYSTSQSTLTSPCIPAGATNELLSGSVSDTVTGEFNVAPLVARGLWYVPAFPGVVQAAGYSLSEDVYKSMGDLLIPRAVAYSAGLLNYFFRGRLDIQIESYNQSDVTLSLKNLAKNDTAYSNNGNSQLIVTYRYIDTNQNEVFGTSDIVPMTAIDDVAPQAQSQSYTFTFPSAIPVGADELEIRLVFLGKLGNEAGAIAVGYKPMTSPGFLVQPSELPADGIAGLRHIYKEDGVWKLSTESGFVVGNVDWKGHDPEDVLSFDGPQSRYYFGANRSGYSASIYRKGRLLAQVPDSWVHGVGIRTFNDKRYLTIISYARGIGMLYVYSREFAAAYPNNDMYDAVINPLGWKLLASYDTSSLGYTSTPFFMNASGTEAQGIYGGDGVYVPRFATRIKLTIDGDLVSRSDFDNRGSYLLTSVDSTTFSPSFTAKVGSLVGGEGSACPIFATECLAYCGTSTTACDHPQYDILSSSLQRDKKSTSYAGEQEVALAVDYIGDREVFATFEAGGVPVSVMKEITSDSRNYFDMVASCSTNALVTNDYSRTISERYSYTGDGGHRLRLGASEIPVSWKVESGTHTVSDTITNHQVREGSTLIANDQDRQFSYTGSEQSTSVVGKIIYLDLRYDDAVHSQLESTWYGTDTSTGVPEEILNGRTNQHVYSELSNLLGGGASLHSWTGDAQASSFPGTFKIQGIGSCSEVVENNTTSRSIGYGPSQAWLFMHDEAVRGLNTQSLQGYARDMNGNLFASQTLWEEQFPPPTGQQGPQQVGKWNYLTDGDPVALLGLTGPDPYFTRVGLY